MRAWGATVARLAVAMAGFGTGACLAAPACEVDQPATTVVAQDTGEVFVRAATATYRCTGLTPGVYYYFCAGAAGREAAQPRGTPGFRLLNLFGQPLAASDLLRAFRAESAARGEAVPLFRLGVPRTPDADAGTYATGSVQVLDVVEGGTVFSSREGCGAGRRVAQLKVPLALRLMLPAVCEVSLSPQLAFGRAPPSWDLLPDPAARLGLKCAAQVPWRLSLDDGMGAVGDGPLRRHMAPKRLAYGVRAGVTGEADFTGVTGRAGTASVPMRGYVPGNPRAEGLGDLADTVITTLDF